MQLWKDFQDVLSHAQSKEQNQHREEALSPARKGEAL